MVIGSILGALLATVFNSHFVNVIYIIIAVLALILMFIKITPSTSHIKFNRVLLITIGSILGLVSGIVGAGGAFIIKLLQGYIPINSAIPLILGSILFTPLGMKIGQKIPDYIQKVIVSVLIVFAIIKLIF
ncbi:hypothetical protein LamDB_49620 [Bacillus anthracis]|jgi:uncharacterized membrane protein YfcA|uniref:Probable membrane transporter protein n=2 Tax=Bacillales TaxID=1385 RepID=A0A640N015_BACAN|nr:Sulfite exporter TauE/SafE [Staphylococcus haemolyticus]BAO96340.1 hypothetical protein [Staphylococcus haemolyticus]GEU19292.1 hypothetical protein LamDB_49620 [Bacillus anthracis]